MSYSERVLRLVLYFRNHNYSQYEGEWLLKTKSLETLEEMFGLVKPE